MKKRTLKSIIALSTILLFGNVIKPLILVESKDNKDTDISSVEKVRSINRNRNITAEMNKEDPFYEKTIQIGHENKSKNEIDNIVKTLTNSSSMAINESDFEQIEESIDNIQNINVKKQLTEKMNNIYDQWEKEEEIRKTEIERLQEEKLHAIEQQKNEVTEVQSQEVNKQEKSNQIEVRTYGFNFLGYHFPLDYFAGTGSVPQNTNYIYQWSDRPSHYLVERISNAGRVIQQIKLGDTITVENETFTVSHIKRGVVNDNTALSTLKEIPARLTFQTCETNVGYNGKSLLTIWYAN